MKTSVILIFVTAISIILATSCSQNNVSDEQLSPLKGKLIDRSICKSLKSVRVTTDTPDSLSCIEYSFDQESNLLTVMHINAGFNCCPDTTFCDVTVSNDTIVIQEFENVGMCECNCLYDLTIELSGVTQKKYQIKFIEPYLGENEEINFEMDLTDQNEGSYCVTRKLYPWGMLSQN